jgi:tetratricopeptide (TPR) repeat protein
MAEEIITGLARMRWLMVIARNSTFAYKGMAPDVRKVGRELGVRYVLEGSVRKAGERVRITAQLIEAQTGGHLWADRYDGTLADVFDLQDQIAANVVAAIEPSVRHAEIERVKRKRPESLDAYDLYLRALPHAGSYTLDGCLSAIDLLDRALEREPDFAEAHGLAAKCHFHCFFDHGRAESGERSLEHAKAVLALPTADAATLAYAAEALTQRREYRDKALDLIDRALALNPSSLPAHSYGAVINLFESRWERAVKLGEEALRLNPFDPQRATAFAAIGPSKLMLGDLRGAEAAERATLQLRPNHVQSRLWLITILVGLERIDEARKAAADFLTDHPQFRIGMFIERQPLGDEANNVMASALRRAGLPG